VTGRLALGRARPNPRPNLTYNWKGFEPPKLLVADADSTMRVYLTDFGVSVVQSSQRDLTRAGQWAGTRSFVAPEQIRGLPVDARADVYALGGVLYQCLTGKVPYPDWAIAEALASPGPVGCRERVKAIEPDRDGFHDRLGGGRVSA
jgi:serine/threonine protein kinase